MLMGGDRAAMVFADPPLSAAIKTVPGCRTVQHRERVQGAAELNWGFLEDTLSLAAKYSVKGSIHYVCVDWRHLHELFFAGNKVYGAPLDLIVCVNTTTGQGSLYRSQHELIVAFKNGEKPHVKNIEFGRRGRIRTNVWNCAGIESVRSGRCDRFHSPGKPVTLIADAMCDCSRRGDIVLDPFAGSGPTILAAERVGRRGYGLEIDPRHVDLAVQRWRALTKREALLKSTGQTFAEVTAARGQRLI
jgi:hypothetical protein